MVGKRISPLFPIEKKLVSPNQALGFNIGFWWITQTLQGASLASPGIFICRPFGVRITKNLVGGYCLSWNFFNGLASGLLVFQNPCCSFHSIIELGPYNFVRKDFKHGILSSISSILKTNLQTSSGKQNFWMCLQKGFKRIESLSFKKWHFTYFRKFELIEGENQKYSFYWPYNSVLNS